MLIKWLGLATVAAIPYFLQANCVYNDAIKSSKYYMLLSLSTTLLGALIWFTLVKYVPRQYLYITSSYWDTLLVGCYLIVPIIFYGEKMSIQGIVGLLMMLGGVVLIGLK